MDFPLSAHGGSSSNNPTSSRGQLERPERDPRDPPSHPPLLLPPPSPPSPVSPPLPNSTQARASRPWPPSSPRPPPPRSRRPSRRRRPSPLPNGRRWVGCTRWSITRPTWRAPRHLYTRSHLERRRGPQPRAPASGRGVGGRRALEWRGRSWSSWPSWSAPCPPCATTPWRSLCSVTPGATSETPGRVLIRQHVPKPEMLQKGPASQPTHPPPTH